MKWLSAPANSENVTGNSQPFLTIAPWVGITTTFLVAADLISLLCKPGIGSPPSSLQQQKTIQQRVTAIIFEDSIHSATIRQQKILISTVSALTFGAAIQRQHSIASGYSTIITTNNSAADNGGGLLWALNIWLLLRVSRRMRRHR
ncbi:MAG: hypothetical protein COB71_03635 [Thiotrichales bacterium]|nr:MAG: hypothetical protein COB71_03635 [Thiotrichales bacterium]